MTGIEAPAVAADGSMSGAGTTELELLRSSGADIVCVALGHPKQELWIDRHRGAIGAPVYIGIGGTLDFVTGVTRRAPAWMQRCGLEWLHRVMREPRRLAGRYARDIIVYLPAVARQARRGRRRSPAVVPTVAAGADGLRVSVHGPLPRIEVEPAVAEALRDRQTIIVDLSDVADIDNATASVLATLTRRARAFGGRLEIVGNARAQSVGAPGDPA